MCQEAGSTGGGGDADGEDFHRIYADLAPALLVWASLRIRPQLRAYCEVEDLLQEVWCRACAIKEKRERPASAVRPWLFRIAKNVLLEIVRKARHAGRVHQPQASTSRLFPLDAVSDQITSITRRVARDDALRAFGDRIGALPEEDRELVVHIGLEGLSYADVATRLGLGHEAVKKRWQRLRARLELQGLPQALLET
jgi:RNA polymerase sigma-70 factor (ECF subfamily)